ncbi:MAG: leucine-rich repeat protein, partial [Clostridia bacterium]
GWYKTNTNERFLGYCQWYIESDVSVTAKWTIATSRLSFNSDKGTTASPIIITYGQNYILPTSTKEGYIFDGWYVDTTKLDGLNWTYDCDITAIAKWVAIDYTITYNVDGGLFDNLPLSTYRVNTADIIFPKLTKLNYTFIGWYETDTFVGEKITSIKTGSLGNKVFYAKWEYGTEGLAYELVENTYIVSSYSGTAITVEIPSTHNGMQVTKIKDNAFSRNAEVISIKLPDTIISIGTYAFSNCPLLNSINIPVSVKNIDAYAYSNCASLTGIIIPKNVSTIKQGVFENCIALTIYTEVYNKYDGWDANWNSSCPYVFACLDNELANDGWTYRIIDSVRYAFKGSNAKVVRQSSSISNDITILSQIRGKGNDICTVTSIDEQAFKGCSRIRSIIIPNSVTDIGANAFYGCASLATATINNGSPLSIIRSDLFQNCYALESIFIPKGVTDISEFAFFGCKSLKSIVFEAGSQLVVVQRYAFSQCENLANFVLPTSVEYIEEQAFSGCKSITEIFIPISTLHIGNSAFARCINLLKIDVDINNPNYTCGGANDVLYSRDLTKILQYALGRKNEMYTVNT